MTISENGPGSSSTVLLSSLVPEADYDTLLTHNPGGAYIFQSRPSAAVSALVAAKGDSIGHCIYPEAGNRHRISS